VIVKLTVSHGSVTTHLRSDMIFSDQLIANFLQSVPLKEFKFLSIWCSYDKNPGAYFLYSDSALFAVYECLMCMQSSCTCMMSFLSRCWF